MQEHSTRRKALAVARHWAAMPTFDLSDFPETKVLDDDLLAATRFVSQLREEEHEVLANRALEWMHNAGRDESAAALFAIGFRRVQLQQGTPDAKANAQLSGALLSMGSGLFWEQLYLKVQASGIFADDWRVQSVVLARLLPKGAQLQMEFGPAIGKYGCRKDENGGFTVRLDGVGVLALGPRASRALALHEVMHACLTFQMNERLAVRMGARSLEDRHRVAGLANYWEDIRVNVAGAQAYERGLNELHELYAGFLAGAAMSIQKGSVDDRFAAWLRCMEAGIGTKTRVLPEVKAAEAWFEAHRAAIGSLTGPETIPMDEKGGLDSRILATKGDAQADRAAELIELLIRDWDDQNKAQGQNQDQKQDKDQNHKPDQGQPQSGQGSGQGGQGDSKEATNSKGSNSADGKTGQEESGQNGQNKGRDKGCKSGDQGSQKDNKKGDDRDSGSCANGQSEQGKAAKDEKGGGDGKSDSGAEKAKESSQNSSNGEQVEKDGAGAEGKRGKGNGADDQGGPDADQGQAGHGQAHGEEGDGSPSQSASGNSKGSGSPEDGAAGKPGADGMEGLPVPIGGEVSEQEGEFAEKAEKVLKALEVNPLVPPGKGASVALVIGDRVIDSFGAASRNPLHKLRYLNTDIQRAARRFKELRSNAVAECKTREKRDYEGDNLSIRGYIDHRFLESRDPRVFDRLPKRVLVNEAVFIVILDASGSMRNCGVGSGGQPCFKVVTHMGVATVQALEMAGYRTALGVFSDSACLLFNGNTAQAERERRMSRLLEVADANDPGQLWKEIKGSHYNGGTNGLAALFANVTAVCRSSHGKPGVPYGMVFTDGELGGDPGEAARIRKTLLPKMALRFYCYPEVTESAVQLVGKENTVGIPALDHRFMDRIVDGFFKGAFAWDGGAPSAEKLVEEHHRILAGARKAERLPGHPAVVEWGR